MPLNHEKASALLPVTAISAVLGFTIVGHGSEIYFYSVGLPTAVRARYTVLPAQQIHGIVTVQLSDNEANVLVWGGCLLCVGQLTLANDMDNTPKGLPQWFSYPLLTAEDWILHAAFDSLRGGPLPDSESRGGNTFAIVTAHNAVYTGALTKTPRETVGNGTAYFPPLGLSKTVHRSRSISYTAHIAWLGGEDLLIALGTAFGEVYVLHCNMGSQVPSSSVVSAFVAHEGSVFGLAISEPLNMYGSAFQTRFLATCSDDRSIRVWPLEMKPSTQFGGTGSSSSGFQGLSLGSEERRTGFGEYRSIDQAIAFGRFKPLASAMGHLSRIWGLHFVAPETTEMNERVIMKVVSVGEDATCQFWDLAYDNANNNPDELTLNHSYTDRSHAGRNIWSSFLNEKGCDRIVLSGGADGGIVRRTATADVQGSNALSFSIADAFADPRESVGQIFDERDRDTIRRDCIRSYAIIGGDKVLVATNSGYVFTANIDEQRYSSVMNIWCSGLRVPELSGYSVAWGVSKLGLAVFGGARGDVFLTDGTEQGTRKIHSAGSKVANVFAFDIGKITEYGDILTAALTYQGGKLPEVVMVHKDIGAWQSRRSLSSSDLDLTKLVFTSATAREANDRLLLALGTRNGFIVALKEDVPSPTEHWGELTDIVIADAHDRDTVTDVNWLPSSDHHDLDSLFSVGRDGCFSIRTVNWHERSWQLVHRLILPIGPSIERLYVDEKERGLAVAAFQGTQFIIYDVLTHSQMTSVDCGGAHRAWAFDFGRWNRNRATDGAFAWTQAGTGNIVSTRQSSVSTIRFGGHGREIKAADITYKPPCGGVVNIVPGRLSDVLIATGAEDTDIRLYTYNQSCAGEDAFHCVSLLRRHKTGITHLQWSPCGNYLFSSGGLEEFFIWRVSQAQVVGLAVFCESSCPKASQGADLRITSFSVIHEHRSSDHSVEQHDKLANMDRKRNAVETTFLISLAFSDSTIKVYSYTSSSSVPGSWLLLAKGQYTTTCLTKTTYIEIADKRHLLTASSDGHLALWPLPIVLVAKSSNDHDQSVREVLEVNCCNPIKVHQSAVKAMASMSVRKDCILVITGGDDNALGITIIRQVDTVLPYGSTVLIPRAHAASLTACTITPIIGFSDSESVNDQFTFQAHTASNDQRIKSWSISIDLSLSGAEAITGVTRRKQDERYTDVADVSGLTVIPSDDRKNDGVLVTGVGMEVWRNLREISPPRERSTINTSKDAV